MRYTLAVFLLGAAVIALSCVEAKRDHYHGSKKNETLPSGSHRTRRQSDDSDEHKRHGGHHRHHHDDNDDNTNPTGGSSFDFKGEMPNMDEAVDAVGSAIEKGQQILNKSMSNFQSMFQGSHRTRRQSDDSDEHKRHGGHHRHHHDDNDDNTNPSGGSSFDFKGKMPNMDEAVDAVGSAIEKGQEILNKSMSNFQSMFQGSHRTRRQSDDSDEHKRHGGHHRHHHDDNDDNTNPAGGSSFDFSGKMPNMDEAVDAVGSVIEKGQEILNKSMSNFQSMFQGSHRTRRQSDDSDEHKRHGGHHRHHHDDNDDNTNPTGGSSFDFKGKMPNMDEAVDAVGSAIEKGPRGFE